MSAIAASDLRASGGKRSPSRPRTPLFGPESYQPKGLCRWFRYDQHLVGSGFAGDADGEQRPEGGVPGVAAVEARGEFVEIGLQVFATQAVIDAECPAFEVGEDAMRPRQDEVGGHRADDVRLVGDAGGAGIAGPAV